MQSAYWVVLNQITDKSICSGVIPVRRFQVIPANSGNFLWRSPSSPSLGRVLHHGKFVAIFKDSTSKLSSFNVSRNAEHPLINPQCMGVSVIFNFVLTLIALSAVIAVKHFFHILEHLAMLSVFCQTLVLISLHKWGKLCYNTDL